MVVCSNCHQPPINPININGQSVYNLTPVQEYMKYCPRCGVKMGTSDMIVSKIGRWKQIPAGITPGGTPMYACAQCGKSEHLHGVEYRRKKLMCYECGSVNVYPWEEIYEEEENI